MSENGHAGGSGRATGLEGPAAQLYGDATLETYVEASGLKVGYLEGPDPAYVDDDGLDYEAPSGDEGGVEELLDELIDIVAAAKSVPLSASVMISRDEVLELLEAAREELPDELRRARRLLKDREEVLSVGHREAREIVEDARVHVEAMVQRTEIVRQAEHRAVRIVEEAAAEARRLTHEAEDFIDQRLAAFEIVLDRTMRTVRTGRERLAVVPPEQPGTEQGGSGVISEADLFFDQDDD